MKSPRLKMKIKTKNPVTKKHSATLEYERLPGLAALSVLFNN